MTVDENVPRIRLKGFGGEWVERPLKKVASDITDGNWIESEHIFASGEYRIIQTGNIGIGQYLDRTKHAKFFHQFSFDAVRGNEIYPGDILISRLAEPAGRAAILPDTGYRMVTAVDVAIVRPEPSFNSYFLMTLLNMDETLKAVGEWVSGTSHKRISHANLVQVKI
jgi:type I restriction enzyme S subunit